VPYLFLCSLLLVSQDFYIHILESNLLGKTEREILFSNLAVILGFHIDLVQVAFVNALPSAPPIIVMPSLFYSFLRAEKRMNLLIPPSHI